LTTIRTIEELSMNALPALQTIHYDGWMLRFANGYPRRANSIHVLYPSLLPLEAKIEFCEQQYNARGFKTVFKMTLAAPSGLDGALKARGYVQDCCTSVQTLDLSTITPRPDASDAVIEPRLSDNWFADYVRLSAVNPERAATMRAILAALPVTGAFIRVCRSGETLAIGLGVLERGWIGLYDIVTVPEHRRQGVGRQLLLHLLRWGKARGAENAYLQVMTNNDPALRLYGELGFHEQYQYWYLQNRLD
jgi:N-acetylglutamate synthase